MKLVATTGIQRWNKHTYMYHSILDGLIHISRYLSSMSSTWSIASHSVICSDRRWNATNDSQALFNRPARWSGARIHSYAQRRNVFKRLVGSAQLYHIRSITSPLATTHRMANNGDMKYFWQRIVNLFDIDFWVLLKLQTGISFSYVYVY